VGCVSLFGAAIVAGACGPAFHVTEETAGSAGDVAGGSGNVEAGNGGAGDGAGGAAAGAPSVGGAGASGGAPSLTRCEELHGYVHHEHCYVDITTASLKQPEAATACDAVAQAEQVPGGLLALNDQPEQDFVLAQFLSEKYTNVSDAWLALTCDEGEHPDVTDCYCAECTGTQLSSKQEAWGWADGTRSNFGWINRNPNNAYRCAALGYNPEIKMWGWVDRPCDQAMISPVGTNEHTYRTICELELEAPTSEVAR